MTMIRPIKSFKDGLEYLKATPPAQPRYEDDLEVSTKEGVFVIAPDLLQLTKRGYSFKELAAGLARQGIEVKAGTLNRYLNEYLASHPETRKPEKPAKTEAGPAEVPAAAPENETGGQPGESAAQPVNGSSEF